MTETLSRLAVCEKENAELKERVNWQDAQLQTWDPIYTIRRALPTEAEAAALLRIVCGRYPHLREDSSEQDCINNFRCALAYVFSLTQTTTPTLKYQGQWWVAEGNTWLNKKMLCGRVRTMVPAIIATGSIPFRLDHGAIYLDPYRARGTAVDHDSWRRVLAGGDLLPATPVKQVDDRSVGPVNQIPSW